MLTIPPSEIVGAPTFLRLRQWVLRWPWELPQRDWGSITQKGLEDRCRIGCFEARLNCRNFRMALGLKERGPGKDVWPDEVRQHA